jgi:hypothetical protein
MASSHYETKITNIVSHLLANKIFLILPLKSKPTSLPLPVRCSITTRLKHIEAYFDD